MSSQETFSITTLQRMCARSEYLDESDIHMNDKTVSYICSNYLQQKKKNFIVGRCALRKYEKQ